MRRVSAILLVDARGRLLLQERDSHAPVAPDTWGMVGGQVEDGEDFEAAAYRELEEETGIRLAPPVLRLWRDERFGDPDDPYEASHCQLWTAPTRLTDADIVVGEGRQIVFVDPGEVPHLDRGPSCAHFTDAFLASPEYAALVAGSLPR
jgi:8-oxo-dGTP diphosphatase